jgi:hypothetical protein
MRKTARKRPRKQEVTHAFLRPADVGAVFEVPIHMLLPSPENDAIYGPCSVDNPDDAALADDVEANGVREPIGISPDWFVVTGHRRLWAAIKAGLKVVSVRVLACSRIDYSRDEWIRLLRQHNFQRERTLDEKLREELVDISPEDAYQVLTEHRRERAALTVETFPIVGTKRRKAVSDAKRFMVAAIKRILKERRQFWPLSDRAIHYAMLNDPPLIHASKSKSRYRNDKRSYDALVELLTRLRLDGTIPFECIADETRPTSIVRCHGSPTPFIAEEVNWFLKGFYRDLQQSQPHLIEVIVEKNTVFSVLKPVADEFCIRITAIRGYSSLPPRIELANRYRASGRDQLIVLIASDFDADGIEIGQSFARSMRDDFGIEKIVPVRVALTPAQVAEYKLPPQLKAKKSSSQYSKFASQFGDDCFELEALEPATLQHVLRNAIEDVLDISAFNAEVDAEKHDAVKLLRLREHVIKAIRCIKGVDLGDGGAA